MKPVTDIDFIVQDIFEDLCYTGLVERVEEVYSAIENPRFEDAGKIHDWRNYVPRKIKKVWDLLDNEARVVAFYLAQLEADREEWD